MTDEETKRWDRMEQKIDRLFSITSKIQIECAKKSCQPPSKKQVVQNGNGKLTGREKFLVSMLGISVTFIGILTGAFVTVVATRGL